MLINKLLHVFETDFIYANFISDDSNMLDLFRIIAFWFLKFQIKSIYIIFYDR